MKAKKLLLIPFFVLFIAAFTATMASAAVRPGFDSQSLPANDDGSTGLVPIGFTIDFFGVNYTDLYVNNNGNVTFDLPLSTFTPFDLTSTGRVIMAPFFADVDTRVGNIVSFGAGTANGYPAFAANWPDVGCFSQITSVLNDFQLVIIDRSDISPGDFDMEFNIDRVEWEAGLASGGDSNCQGGFPARVGYSNGSGDPGTFFELPGSAVPGAFLDSNLVTGLIYNSLNSDVPGRYLFRVRNGIPQTDIFEKVVVDGNDVDENGDIDLAVEVGITDQSKYDFKINYNQPDLPPVQIEDTVPAEWQVTGLVDDSLNCNFAGANGKDNGKSATLLTCLPEGTQGMVTVQVDARCHGSRNNQKCRPTSCGALYLNDGAAAYELDPDTGEPVLDDEGNPLPPLAETNALCLVAVSDLNGSGIDYSGNGDEDGDLIPDYEEACGLGTDPCLSDTDGDGVSDFDEVASGCMDPLNPDTDGDTISDGDELAAGTDPCDEDSDDDTYNDNVDSCPLEGPADPAAGEILMTDGCLRQSQCSDGLDNEPDGNTDFPADASCDDILDDSEDTIDPAGVTCAEIETDMDVWGRTSSGVDLRDYTSSTLHYIGCPGDGCNPSTFYCVDGPGTLQFGTTGTSALRALVDPGDLLGDTMPNSYTGCCSGPGGLCNAPDSNNNGVGVDMVAALCAALGYANGTIVREVNSNSCPEANAETGDGQSWNSDFVNSFGYGAEYLCSN